MAYKTPGVYVQEIALFPPSVAEVETAIPAFIGYTQFALTTDGKSLTDIPTRITSLLEFESLFGVEYVQRSFTVTINQVSNQILDVKPDKRFLLHTSLMQYFDNGGGPCYIVSVGSYTDAITFQPISDGIASLSAYDEPTLILFPDAAELVDATNAPDLVNFSQLQNQALALCAKMQDRFSIFDVLQGDLGSSPSLNPIDNFRNATGINSLNYGAAYYPWIVTSYTINVDFRQLAFQDNSSPAVAINDYTTFSKNATEAALVTTLQSNITDTNLVLSEIFSASADQNLLRLNGTSEISNYLTTYATDVAKDVNVETQLTNYMNLLAAVANSFQKLETSLVATSPLNVDVKRAKADTKLTNAIVDLVGLEKNADLITLMGPRDPSAIYAALDGTDWLNKEAYADVVVNAGVFSNDHTGALEAIFAVQATLTTLMSYFGSILNSVLFYESQAEQALFAGNTFFGNVDSAAILKMRTIPPSGAIAGVYAAVDNARGVWKAPANVSMNNVIGPAVKIDNSDQDDMNVTPTGKSVNAIRAFTGKGTLVWGARTLAGNDNEWRYIPVRRFFIMVEESVKKATFPFVFENNDANTWTKLKMMVQNFLILQWRAGALQGAKPEDAFFVNVGLNETMTSTDILEGRMIVEIGMAVVRPAEFIILRFSHKMQES